MKMGCLLQLHHELQLMTCLDWLHLHLVQDKETVVLSCRHLLAVPLVLDLQSTHGGICLCEPFAQCLKLARFGEQLTRNISTLCYNLFLLFSSSPVVTSQ